MNKEDQLKRYINQNNIQMLKENPALKIVHEITENTEVLLSPLHYAAMEGKLDVCEALYKGGPLECDELTRVVVRGKKIELKKGQEHEYYRDPKGDIHKFNEDAGCSQIVSRVFSLVKFTPLEYAIAYGHKDIVEYFLGFEENRQNIERLLAFAFYYKQDQKLIEFILTHVEKNAIGENCLMKPGYGLIYTPVAYAILNDSVEMLELLKRDGFRFLEERLTGQFRKTSKPILFAVEKNKEKCVEWLLANGVSLIGCGQSITAGENILCAATHASSGILSQILNNLKDDETKKGLLVHSHLDPFPSPLLEAVKQEDSGYIKILMPHYEDYLNSYGTENRRKFVFAVLSKAVEHEKVDHLKLLLSYRVMSDNVDKRLSDTCVSKAIQTNSTEYMQALIDQKILIAFYSSCIQEAVKLGVSKDFLKYLLESGGVEHINESTYLDAETPLMVSLRTNQVELMSLLLDFGADASSEVGGSPGLQPGMPDKLGKTPLYHAIESRAYY